LLGYEGVVRIIAFWQFDIIWDLVQPIEINFYMISTCIIHTDKQTMKLLLLFFSVRGNLT